MRKCDGKRLLLLLFANVGANIPRSESHSAARAAGRGATGSYVERPCVSSAAHRAAPESGQLPQQPVRFGICSCSYKCEQMTLLSCGPELHAGTLEQKQQSESLRCKEERNLKSYLGLHLVAVTHEST